MITDNSEVIRTLEARIAELEAVAETSVKLIIADDAVSRGIAIIEHAKALRAAGYLK